MKYKEMKLTFRIFFTCVLLLLWHCVAFSTEFLASFMKVKILKIYELELRKPWILMEQLWPESTDIIQ